MESADANAKQDTGTKWESSRGKRTKGKEKHDATATAHGNIAGSSGENAWTDLSPEMHPGVD